MYRLINHGSQVLTWYETWREVGTAKMKSSSSSVRFLHYVSFQKLGMLRIPALQNLHCLRHDKEYDHEGEQVEAGVEAKGTRRSKGT